jgi:prevent-host-death family protein
VKIAPLADVKTHFSRFLDLCRDEPVVVTRSGRPAAILVPILEGDDLERLILSHSPRFRRLIAEADARARSDEGLEHDAFWNKVESGHRAAARKPRARKRR